MTNDEIKGRRETGSALTYRVTGDLSLLGMSVRPPKEEICDHCGAAYRGLYHCQSISQIKEIDDSKFIAALRGAAGGEE